MRRIVPAMFVLALLAGACEHDRPEDRAAGERFLPGAGDRPSPGAGGPGGEGQRRGPLPMPDGAALFDVYSFICGTTLGTDQRVLQPDGYFCDVGITVLNQGPGPLRIDPFRQYLHAGGERLSPWEEAMRSIVLNHPDNVFAAAIPPRGGGTGNLIFEIPEDATPGRLELHATGRSSGAVVSVAGCRLWRTAAPEPCALEQRGNAEGTGYPLRAAVRVAYPVSFHFGDGAFLCFDRREWDIDPGLAVGEDVLSRLQGHGVISLRSSGVAEFRDNSGAVLRLVPTPENARDPALCG